MDPLLEHMDRMEDRLRDALRRIEGKIDLTNGRVGKLERWRDRLGAIGAFIAAGVSLVVSLFHEWLSGLWGR